MMTHRIGVRFKPVGKVHDFDAGDLALVPGDRVVVETSRGSEIGVVAFGARPAILGEAGPLKRVLRKATEPDLEKEQALAGKNRRALQTCREKVAKFGLEMDPVEAEYASDHSKVTIYFTAEGRVDFRELVRELVGALRIRVELRQIGVRDEARMVGGLGPCGRPLCCSSFLTEFKPVSIKMAKEQNLSLNPAKISGVCGRLMCCLRYESELTEAERDGEARVAAGRAGKTGGSCCGSKCDGCTRWKTRGREQHEQRPAKEAR